MEIKKFLLLYIVPVFYLEIENAPKVIENAVKNYTSSAYLHINTILPSQVSIHIPVLKLEYHFSSIHFCPF